MGKLKVSVVLCCYNGEKYIEEQMESLKNQTRVPDEVLIVDDCSTDSTIDLVVKYIEKNDLKTWKVMVNDKNKGWKTNFIEGLKQAEGEILFPCDQDDVWESDKIENMAKILEDRKEILLLVGNYQAFYQGNDYRKIDKVFYKKISNDQSIVKIPADKKGVYILRPGCVMGFRKEFFEKCLKYTFSEYPHDALLWRTAVFSDGLYQYNQNVISFRRHGENASDAKQHRKKEKLDSINYYIRVCDKLLEMANDDKNGNMIKLISNIAYFWKLRKKFYEKRSLICGLRLLLFKHSYYLTWKAALGDWVIGLGNK